MGLQKGASKPWIYKIRQAYVEVCIQYVGNIKDLKKGMEKSTVSSFKEGDKIKAHLHNFSILLDFQSQKLFRSLCRGLTLAVTW